MSQDSKIEWTDHTFNPWEGCQRVGPGCDHCYAETRNARYSGGQAINWGPGAPRRRTSVSNWNLPRRWNAQAEAFQAQLGRRQRVFCASLADVFDNAVDPQWRADLFALIRDTPNLDWLLLTKRIGNVPAMVAIIPGWLPENVWLGATITSQAEADRDIPKLLRIPASVRFLSMEPLLGPVSFEGFFANPDNISDGTNALEALDWVIAGGESGPGARPTHPNWHRELRDQCEAVGTPFLFKQWGEFAPALSGLHFLPLEGCPQFRPRAAGQDTHDFGDGYGAVRIGKKAAGRELDGKTWDEFPAP
ncbi:phage Gp37/Gp68 family protein [Delftia tsuruhatensis]|jgi:protein gp37|uniref:phage Gp37/Gp68 family protein n=1 Tax=Delftia tsuruhatensis TaxID=180282 RepID=UPI00244810B3|nr:phage Gp37/Gp68 family protein [Delftia tsuruhatensis]MDH0422136.1 phage Gp37/Gp68 family protein [Delftia tsuruhatensis]